MSGMATHTVLSLRKHHSGIGSAELSTKLESACSISGTLLLFRFFVFAFYSQLLDLYASS